MRSRETLWEENQYSGLVGLLVYTGKRLTKIPEFSSILFSCSLSISLSLPLLVKNLVDDPSEKMGKFMDFKVSMYISHVACGPHYFIESSSFYWFL